MPDPLAVIEPSAAVTELEALAEKLGVTVDYDHFTGDGMGSGGLCKVRGQWRLIVERQSSPGEKASVLARALARFDLESHFISPAVRELIERLTGAPAGEQEPSAEEPAAAAGEEQAAESAAATASVEEPAAAEPAAAETPARAEEPAAEPAAAETPERGEGEPAPQ